MKKTIKPIVMALLCLYIFSTSLTAHAQPPDSSDILGNVHYFYSGLDSNSITTKILIDRTPSLLDVSNFDGASNSDTVDSDEWGQLYFDLYNTKYPSINMVSYDSVLSLSSFYLDQGKYPLGILNYDYNYIDTMALYNDSIVLDTINNKLVEAGASTSNYKTDRIFASAFTRVITRSNTVSFVLPGDMYFKNVSGTYTFEVDFDNGEGYNTVVLDSTYTITYTDTGEFEKIIGVKATNGANVYFSKTGFIRKHDVESPYSIDKADFIDPVEYNCGLISGYDVGNARAYIHYADISDLNNLQIKKPFIFVEGFDDDNNPDDDHYGDIGWGTYSTGKTFSEDGKELYPQLAKMPDLLAALRAKGYDVIIIDFQDGTTYIQKNANALVKLIQWVNDNKVGNEENIIAGASMGGLISRYALAHMEKNGCNHCSKMMITFDSPHQGANIPLGIQHLLRFNSVHSKDSWYQYHRVVSSPAVLQMAVNHANPIYTATHSAWVADYAAIGYPQKTLNTAIVNGDKDGDGLGFDPGDKLINYIYNIVGTVAYTHIWALNNQPSNTILKLKVPKGGTKTRKTINTLAASYFAIYGLPLQDFFYHRYSVSVPSSLPYDNAPGSANPFPQDVFDAIEKEAGGSITELTMPSGNMTSFISTLSALDISSTNLFLDFSIPSNLDLSPFYEPFTQGRTNERHVELTDGTDNVDQDNIDWLEKKIDLVEQQLTSNLPTGGNNTYNFGKEGRNRIPAMSIDNLGVLQVNGNYNTAYGAEATPAQGSIFEVVTASCDPTITIKNGGKIIVGDASASPDNIGILRLRKGSTLIIESGGTLEIQEGSKLVVEYGAMLIYKSGAIIKLDGANAVLEVIGELEIQSGASFTVTSTSGTTNGFVRFDMSDYPGHQPITVTGTTANISLAGDNVQGMYQDKVLEVIGGSLTTPDNSLGATEYLSSLTIYNGMVNLQDGAKIAPTVTSSFTYTYFNGEGSSSTEYGLDITKPSLTTINHCSFSGLDYCIKLDLTGYTSAFPISYSTFGLSNMGIYSGGGGGLDISNCNFSNVETAIRGTLLTQDCEFTDCNFSYYLTSPRASSVNGVILESSVSVNSYFYHSLFDNLDVGIHALVSPGTYDNVNVTLKCNKFKDNRTGVQVGSDLNLSPNKTLGGYSGGDNVFYYSPSSSGYNALYPQHSLYLDNGGNSFIDKSTSGLNSDFIVGSVDKCSPTPCAFYNTSTSLIGAGNYWDPAPSLNDLNNGNGSLYLILEDQSTPYLDLDGPVITTFTSTCFSIPSGTEPQFVSSGTGPFNKNGDEPEKEEETVEEQVGTTKITVFPNPTKESLYIQTGLKEQKTYTLELFDLLGKKVLSEKIVSSDFARIELKTSSIYSGTYILSITTTDGSVNENHRIMILD